MKVILNQTVPKVGKQGTVVTVADGYARNFLFPRGLAILADKRQVASLEKRHARLAVKTAGEKSVAEELRDRINGAVIRLPGNVGQGGTKLFGAITAQDVADAIKSQLNVEIDRRKVGLVEPIRRLGAHPIELDLHREVDAHITVEVYDPNAPIEPKPEQPAADFIEA